MYKQGELEVGTIRDSRTDDYDDVIAAYLPHSCDAWVIGGSKEIKALIADLQVALVKLNTEDGG